MIFASSGCTALVLDPFILASDMEYKNISYYVYIYIYTDMLIIIVSINEYISECMYIYTYKYIYIISICIYPHLMRFNDGY